MKIDLGCGKKFHPGVTRVDMYPGNHPDIIADITKPIFELPDGCAEQVICHHVLEHLPEIEDWRLVMTEMARLLKKGGTFEIRVPHPSHDCAMIHGHVHVFTPTFWRDMRDQNWLDNVLVIDGIEECFDPEFLKDREKIGKPPEAMLRYLRNVYLETCVTGHKP